MDERKRRRRIRQNYCIIGVYSITNMVNGKVYVGSSTHLIQRLKSHEKSLIDGTHGNKKMQRDYDCVHKFQFDILEIFSVEADISSRKCRGKYNLNELEAKYIQKYDCLNSGYNVQRVVCANNSKCTDETTTADVVSRDCFNRILAENDIMREQLAKIGKKPGDSMDDVKHVISFAEWIPEDPVVCLDGSAFYQKHRCSHCNFYARGNITTFYCENCGSYMKGMKSCGFGTKI